MKTERSVSPPQETKKERARITQYQESKPNQVLEAASSARAGGDGAILDELAADIARRQRDAGDQIRKVGDVVKIPEEGEESESFKQIVGRELPRILAAVEYAERICRTPKKDRMGQHVAAAAAEFYAHELDARRPIKKLLEQLKLRVSGEAGDAIDNPGGWLHRALQKLAEKLEYDWPYRKS